jgi:tetratricopeptide (TPR) repeat protein
MAARAPKSAVAGVKGVIHMSSKITSAAVARERAALVDAHRRARRLAAKGDFASAIELLRGRVRCAKRPHQRREMAALVRALITLGSCCVEAGLTQEGMRHLRRAIDLDPRNAEAYCALAGACESSHLPDVAVELYQEAVRADPDCACAHKSLASYYLAQERFEDAVRECLRATELDPAYEPGYVELALASERAGDAAQAAAALEQAIRLNPDNLQYRLGLARNLMLQGRLRESADSLRRTARAFPDSIEARCALAEVCADLGCHDETIEHAREIRVLAPTNPAGYELLAVGYYQSGRLADALAAVRRLTRLQPREAHHHLKLGVLLQQQGHVAQAMHEYLRAEMMSAGDDDDTAHACRQAIDNLDDVQVRQVLLRAAEDRVFRVKLVRDPARALRDHGFHLSDEAMDALSRMDLELTHPWADDAGPRVYH